MEQTEIRRDDFTYALLIRHAAQAANLEQCLLYVQEASAEGIDITKDSLLAVVMLACGLSEARIAHDLLLTAERDLGHVLEDTDDAVRLGVLEASISSHYVRFEALCAKLGLILANRCLHFNGRSINVPIAR
jgi:hypothetical protein